MKAQAICKNGKLESYDSVYKNPIELSEENKKWLDSNSPVAYATMSKVTVKRKILEMQKQLAEKDAVIAELKSSVDELDDAICEEIYNRDNWEAKATKLADCVGEYFNEYIGEHSSANCPILNAHEILNRSHLNSEIDND